MNRHSKFVLILVSGGIDSTACINFYRKLKYNIQGVFIDYGQASSKKEAAAVKLISDYYKISITKITIRNSKKFKDGLVRGRNAFLYFCAIMNCSNTHGIIASGIHSGTKYYDCSQQFLTELQTMFKNYTNGELAAEAPFLNFTKKEIWDYCIIEKVPLNITYSCELGLKQPCKTCLTCKDLKSLYASKK